MCSVEEFDIPKYDFPTKQLPVLNYDDSAANELIDSGRPVILKNSNLVGSAKHWTLDYLKEHIGNGDFSVYKSTNHIFKYYDEKKVSGCTDFVPSMIREEMKFSKFYEIIKSTEKKADNLNGRVYLQQSLNDTVGPNIVKDFIHFNWPWITNIQRRNNWGPLTSNLLLISQSGNLTPCHYDEQENLFAQVEGHKRVILFAPDQFECLYTYPVYHPHDRQSQVNFEQPDYVTFPKFRNVLGFEGLLGPGDVLYLPSYWFHHFETVKNCPTATSITFWYKAAPVGEITYPLKPHQKMAMMRNIEKMITEALHDNKVVAPFMEAMVAGRYMKI